MRWVAASACGVAVYWLVGTVSDAEPMMLRGAWGVTVGVAVLLLAAAYHH
jgi:hypothetical protein